MRDGNERLDGVAGFQPRDTDYRSRVTESFERQPFVNLVGGELRRVDPGKVDIALPFKPELAQQHGYVHGGVITSIADAAAGCAAMTLAAVEVGVLTTELKVNFLRPARDGVLCAKGRVIKTGRTLTIVQADVTEMRDGEEVHVLTGLVTLISVEGLI